ncbi:MAG: hypothetical protein KIT33_11120 [Candidatus Kapabacteria bacterium]|nr:hypothetical protein [Ignavibacteriota bacterium]MCW5885508.1 hypothetical protein [Candidatus Kapabacteria bacterium]
MSDFEKKSYGKSSCKSYIGKWLLSHLLLILFLFNNIIYANDDVIESDSLRILPNSLSYGIDKQLNIYSFNLLMNYQTIQNFGTFNINQKFLGTAYAATNTILQDDEELELTYSYPLSEYFSILSSGNFVMISNRGSTELNELSRFNMLSGTRINFANNINLDLQAGREQNNQMGIESAGNIFKIDGLVNNYDIEGYSIDANLKGEHLSLSLDRINRTYTLNTMIHKQFDYYDMLSMNFSYKLLDRYNAFRRDAAFMDANNLDFAYSLEGRSNNVLNTDVNFSFGLSEKINGIMRLSFYQNQIERQFTEFIESDPRTGVRQFRNQLRIQLNPEIYYISNNLNQMFGFYYAFDSDENRMNNISNIREQDFNLLRTRAFELDNLTKIFRVLSRTKVNITSKDTIYLSAMTSITRFDTPSETNNSDRDEFLGLISLGYGKSLSDILTFRLDAESQFNHQVNLKASRSSSNFWMRSIKFAPSLEIQTKYFYMRPQPYVLANYTVYDFEGFAPGLRSFSLRQIGYNDSIAVIIGKNLYMGSRIDLIYKETGILFWNDFREQPVNGNLKLFLKYFTGYFDDHFNIALGFRYFNLTQQTFRTSAFVNADYKTESYAPEVIISAEFPGGTVFRLNGWYEFQIINDTFKNEIPNIILNTSIRL